MFIERLKRKFNTNEPILTSEIMDLFSEYSRAYVFRLIEKAEQNGELVKFFTGIYYIPTNSLIGLSTITVEDVINKKYIKYNSKFYGIYSGLVLKNAFSLTTQMPNTIEIVTNNESMRRRKIVIDGREIILRKSRCEITSDNVSAYTVLQVITEMAIEEYMEDRTRQSILKYMKMNNVTSGDLLSLVRVFPAQTTKKLLYSGVLNEFAQR